MLNYFHRSATVAARIAVCLLALAVVADATHAAAPAPADLGWVDVTQPPYSAPADGRTDATAALQRAISETLSRQMAAPAYLGGRITVYLPAGTYLISDTLWAKQTNGIWANGLILRGAGPGKTTIRLRDGAAGFNDPLTPRPLLVNASRQNPDVVPPSDPAGRAREARYAANGGSNKAFGNVIRDLTISVGRTNAGAIGIDFLTSNYGQISDVAIVSEDGQGVCALELTRELQGPGFVRRLSTRGFDYGIRAAHGYHMTLEHITVESPKVAGLLNNGLALSIRDLVVRDAPLAIEGREPGGHLALLGARLTGRGEGSAIVVKDTLYARDLVAEKFSILIEHDGFVELGDVDSMGKVRRLARFQTAKTLGPQQPPAAPLDLPVEDAPALTAADLADGVTVEEFGAVAGDGHDDADAIQRALDSGHRAVWFARRGASRYDLSRPIVVRGAVRYVGGNDASLQLKGEGPAVNFLNPQELVVEDLWAGAWHLDGPGAVVLRGTSGIVSNGPAARKLFLEDYMFNYGLAVRGPQFQVWARQLNTENREAPGVPNIVVADGASLWVLGLKTEMPTTILAVRDGGRAEVLGGYVNPITPCDAHTPAFQVENAAFTFSGAFRSSWGFYDLLAESFLDTGTARWRRSDGSGLSTGQPVVSLYAVRPAAVLPTVRLRAVPVADADTLRFRISRSGETAAPLYVALAAAENAGYVVPTEVAIPAGQAETVVAVEPRGKGTRVLDVAIAPRPGRYVPGRDSAVAVLPASTVEAPPVTNGLVQHLSPAAAFAIDRVDMGYRVRVWPDASGRGHAATAGGDPLRPFLEPAGLGGRPALRFSRSFLLFKDDPDLNAAPAGYPAKTLAWVLRTGSDVTSRQLLQKQGGFTRGLNLYLDGGRLYFHVFNVAEKGWGQVSVSLPIKPDTDCVVLAGFDSATGRVWLRLNGEEAQAAGAGQLPKHDAPGVYPYTASFGGLQGGALPLYHDGRHEVRYGVFFEGLLGELLHYNRVLTPEEVRSLESWLRRG